MSDLESLSNSERAVINSYLRFIRASASTTDIASRDLLANGLTGTQYGVLDNLYHQGPMRIGELAEHGLKSCGNLTLVVDNLEKMKLVKRNRDESDRRVVVVNLTAKGDKLISKLFPKHVEDINAAMSGLTKSELKELARICRKLSRKHEDVLVD
jgi:MarR family 2-MHQ and catechol resistance regulon transcriptional repressor